MNKDRERFFHLVRCGMGGEDLCLPLFADGSTDWEYLFGQAQRQTVTGIVFDALLSLPAELLPPRKIYLKFCVAVARIEECNEKMNRTLCDVLDLLDSATIDSLLLKGQGAATRYPKPEHRMCGDIDLYLNPSDMKKVEHLFALQGIRKQEGGEEKHVGYTYQGIVLEMHHLLIRFSNPWNHKRLKRIVSSGLSDPSERIVISCFSDSSERTVTNRREVPVLPATLDAFYQLAHMYYHILEGGIGLRQICDWALLIRRRKHGVEVTLFKRYLKRFRFSRMYGAVAYIAVNCLGIPAEELPLPLQKRDSFHGKRLLSLVLKGGNFGRYDAVGLREQKANRRARFGNYLRACKMSFLFFRLSPFEAVWFPVQKLRFYLKKKSPGRGYLRNFL